MEVASIRTSYVQSDSPYQPRLLAHPSNPPASACNEILHRLHGLVFCVPRSHFSEAFTMLASCSTSVISLPRRVSSCPRAAAAASARRRLTPVYAGNDQNTDANPSSSATVSEEEARIEALENQLRKAKPQRASRKIPIRNMTPKQESSSSSRAEWKEGKLFPEGWEQMDPIEKATELYLGQRGVLFWMNKVAYASVFVLGGAWVLFRFVGPALGLYKLDGDLTPPPV